MMQHITHCEAANPNHVVGESFDFPLAVPQRSLLFLDCSEIGPTVTSRLTSALKYTERARTNTQVGRSNVLASEVFNISDVGL